MHSSTKKFFTVIEIALALSILALGATFVVGLYPLAIQSSKKAAAENTVSSVAQYFISYVKALSQNPAEWEIGGKLSALPNYTEYKYSNLPTQTSVANWFDSAGKIKGSAVEVSDNLYYNSSNGNYLFSKVKNNIGMLDVSAEIRVWEENFDFKPYPGSSAAGKKIYIEISWPLGRDYVSRTKATYAMDIFNIGALKE